MIPEGGPELPLKHKLSLLKMRWLSPRSAVITEQVKTLFYLNIFNFKSGLYSLLLRWYRHVTSPEQTSISLFKWFNMCLRHTLIIRALKSSSTTGFSSDGVSHLLGRLRTTSIWWRTVRVYNFNHPYNTINHIRASPRDSLCINFK